MIQLILCQINSEEINQSETTFLSQAINFIQPLTNYQLQPANSLKPLINFRYTVRTNTYIRNFGRIHLGLISFVT